MQRVTLPQWARTSTLAIGAVAWLAAATTCRSRAANRPRNDLGGLCALGEGTCRPSTGQQRTRVRRTSRSDKTLTSMSSRRTGIGDLGRHDSRRGLVGKCSSRQLIPWADHLTLASGRHCVGDRRPQQSEPPRVGSSHAFPKIDARSDGPGRPGPAAQRSRRRWRTGGVHPSPRRRTRPITCASRAAVHGDVIVYPRQQRDRSAGAMRSWSSRKDAEYAYA